MNLLLPLQPLAASTSSRRIGQSEMIYSRGNVYMELEQGDESAHEDPGQQEDKREQVQPPTPMQFQVPESKVPGSDPYQPAGQQYVQQPYRPDYQQPFQPGAQQFGGQPQPWGPQQQWNPGMPFPPYGLPPRGHGRMVQNLFIGFGALIIAVIVFVAVSLIAHTDQSTRTAASSNSQANGNTGANGNNAPVGNAGTGTQTAQIGSAITLAGLATGEQMSVTVTKVYSDAQPIDQYNEAPGGERLYAVAFKLENTGSAGYSDAPSNSAVVFDSTGQSYQTQFDDVTECQTFRAVLDIAVGSSSVGCIVYEVPIDVKITKVQVILDSGYGPQTGEWKIGKPQQ
jgi:hypothetical protein